MITFAYFTCRKDPKIEWFFNSLNRELNGDWSNVKILIIDYHSQYNFEERELLLVSPYRKFTENIFLTHPKPTAWQGKWKTTTQHEYFAASNARNTAFLLCDTEYIVCVDDLSVMKPGYFKVIEEGYKNKEVLLGAYAKVNDLTVSEEGEILFDNKSTKLDSRFNNSVLKGNKTRVSGSWLFGCSFAMPLELAFKIDGFDEACDGQGAEDYDFGIRLNRVTTDIFYCKEMFTYESDELHFVDTLSFKRDSKILSEETLMPSQKGIMSDHAMLNYLLKQNTTPFPFLKNNLTSLKEEMKQRSFVFPIREIDWRTGKLISEL